MNITMFKDVLKTFLGANVPLHVWGDGGIGKSQVIESVIENDLKWHLVDLRLATQEVGDLIGLPCTELRKVSVPMGFNDDGSIRFEKVEKSVQSWSMPEWMVGILEAAAQNIPSLIFMDEMDRAPKEVIQAVYQLCTKKQLHHHVLPRTTRIVAAGNPPTEEYMVDAFDHAMTSRWGHVYIEPDADTWIAQFGHRCNADISGFIATAKKHLMRQTSAWDVDAVCRPTPRGWEMANKIYDSNVADRNVLRLCLSAILGAATANEFIISLDKDWIRLEDILAGKKTVKDIEAADDANIKTIRLAHELSHYMTNSMITTKTSGDKYSKSEAEKRKENLSELVSFLAKNRKELIIACLKSIHSRDPMLNRTLITSDSKIAEVVSEAADLSRLLGTR